ncbi:MAG: hypothetical protein A2077_07725 [Nitrospirae bacterium GWC2_46_6]|nr:MAG: hypothetical protein A2077_07725 [Nitrospirae bacterium GWC2_46_6]
MYFGTISGQEKEFKRHLFRVLETFQPKVSLLIGDLFAEQDRRTAFILKSAYENLDQLYHCLIDKCFDPQSDCYDESIIGIREKLGTLESSLIACDNADGIIEAASSVIYAIWHAYLELGVKPIRGPSENGTVLFK